MSFAPPSLQNVYALISAHDPALNLPSDAKEKENALRIARETGNWQALVKAGEHPTTFYMRPLSGSVRTWLIGYQTRHQLTGIELAELVFRLAIDKVDNFGSFAQVKRTKLEGQDVATLEIIDAIYGIPEVGSAIIDELGGVVLVRLMEGISPK